jgi:hypothetical protein
MIANWRRIRENLAQEFEPLAGEMGALIVERYPFSRRPVALLFLTVMTGHYRLARLRILCFPRLASGEIAIRCLV